jgi:hypothetical protein
VADITLDLDGALKQAADRVGRAQAALAGDQRVIHITAAIRFLEIAEQLAGAKGKAHYA